MILLISVNHSSSKVFSYNGEILPNQGYAQNVDHNITSQFTGRTYWLKVDLPEGYSPTGASYPVLFFFDYLVGTRGGNVLDVYEWLSPGLRFAIQASLVPDLILIDILDSEFEDSIYTENMIESPNNTMAFLENELIPFLDELGYNMDYQNLMLSGSYRSGFMTLYSYFHFPESIINHFITFNGKFHAMNSTIFEYEELFYNQSKEQEYKPRTLYIGVEHADASEFNAGLRLTRTLYERSYSNQHIIFDFLDFSWEEDAILRGVQNVIIQQPSISIVTDVDIDYWLRDTDEYRFYANETIVFYYWGQNGKKELTYEWRVDGEFVGNESIMHHQFNDTQQYIITLTIFYGTSSSLQTSKSIAVSPEREPPFDFHTALTTLNTEAYVKIEITEGELSINFQLMFIAIITKVYIVRRFSKKSNYYKRD